MPNLRTFDLNLLVAFDLLMQEQNVSRAAERMFVSQSAMSHILQRLRQQLNDPLLVKTPGGMKPTERAVGLVEPVRVVLREVERLIRTPEDFDPATSQRRFVIAATDYVEFVLMPPLVALIHAEAPGVDLHVKRTESPFPDAQLESGELDVVLGFAVMLNPPNHLRTEKLFDDRMACVVRQGHRLAEHAAISLEEYVTLHHMLISRTGIKVGVIDEPLAQRGLERRIALTVPHFLSAPLIVANTDMVLSLPLRIAERFASLVPLKIWPVPIELPAYDVSMIWHPLRESEPSHRWLRERIVTVSQQLVAG